MSAIFKIHRFLFHQAKISLMDESRGLQRVIGTLFAKVAVCQSTELLVNQRYQEAQRFFITGRPFGP
jgi:hypothetical protein